jgi:hypothetical protein
MIEFFRLGKVPTLFQLTYVLMNGDQHIMNKFDVTLIHCILLIKPIKLISCYLARTTKTTLPFVSSGGVPLPIRENVVRRIAFRHAVSAAALRLPDIF